MIHLTSINIYFDGRMNIYSKFVATNVHNEYRKVIPIANYMK